MGHNLAVCSNRGSCDTDSGVCSCITGFTGAACERSTTVFSNLPVVVLSSDELIPHVLGGHQ
jgi:hypothetical protein